MKGFSLIELMIVICIVGIFAAFAVGAYKDSQGPRSNKIVIEIDNAGMVCAKNNTPIECSNLESTSDDDMVYFPNGIRANATGGM